MKNLCPKSVLYQQKILEKRFGGEAARVVRDWGFDNTKFDYLYSYLKYKNVASYSTAVSIGASKPKEYPNEKDTFSCVYAITRQEWDKLKRR